MQYVIRMLSLLLIGCSIYSHEPELGYQEQLEAAIVQSNASKVVRLLKRRTRISVKNFNYMLGWANDTIEERRTLEPTPTEVFVRTGAIFASGIVSLASFFYYFDINNMQSDVRSDFLGEEKGFFTLLALTGLASSYGLYSTWAAPRARLTDSYAILFALEDTVETMEKKKKMQAAAALKRSLRSQRIR